MTKLESLNECRGYLGVFIGKARADAMSGFELAAAVREHGAELAPTVSLQTPTPTPRADSATAARRNAVQRFDVGRLDRAKRTGAGGARVAASVSRTGVQSYTDERGRVVREYRPPEAVFAPESLATLGSIPVTVGHPPGGVTPQNYRQLSVGHVSDGPAGRRADGPAEWLETAVVVNDAATLQRIELPPTDPKALVEVSMGYLADVIPEAGIAPDGQHYDAKQTNIRFNHLALLPSGHARAGSGARLRLDGNQECAPSGTRKEDRRADAYAASFGPDATAYFASSPKDRRADAYADSFREAKP
jgi:hypothetical protein